MLTKFINARLNLSQPKLPTHAHIRVVLITIDTSVKYGAHNMDWRSYYAIVSCSKYLGHMRSDLSVVAAADNLSEAGC